MTMETNYKIFIFLIILLIIIYLVYRHLKCGCNTISGYRDIGDGICYENDELIASYNNTQRYYPDYSIKCCPGLSQIKQEGTEKNMINVICKMEDKKYQIGPDKFGNYYYTAFQGDGTFPQAPSVIFTSPSNSYIDNIDKCLHIRINYNEQSGYTGAEAVLLKNLVYGTYSFTLDFSKNPDGINFIRKDPNVVCGIFTFKRNNDSTSGQGFCYPNICKEIDFIEWGKFGVADGNANYSGDWGVQPWYKCNGTYSATECDMDQSAVDELRIQKIKDLNLTSDILTIKSVWKGPFANLEFKAYSGNDFTKPVLSWDIAPDTNGVEFIPSEDVETYLHFNLWCVGPPKGPCEVILSDIKIPIGCEYQELKEYNHACEFIKESVDAIKKLDQTINNWEYRSRVSGRGPNYDGRCFKFDLKPEIKDGYYGFYSIYLEDALKVIDLECANENQAMLILPILYNAILGYHNKLITFFDIMYTKAKAGSGRYIATVTTDQLTSEILNSDGTSKVNYSNVARLGYYLRITIYALEYEYKERIKNLGCVFTPI